MNGPASSQVLSSRTNSELSNDLPHGKCPVLLNANNGYVVC